MLMNLNVQSQMQEAQKVWLVHLPGHWLVELRNSIQVCIVLISCKNYFKLQNLLRCLDFVQFFFSFKNSVLIKRHFTLNQHLIFLTICTIVNRF